MKIQPAVLVELRAPLIMLFENLFYNANLMHDWKQALISVLFKKEPGSYRPCQPYQYCAQTLRKYYNRRDYETSTSQQSNLGQPFRLSEKTV